MYDRDKREQAGAVAVVSNLLMATPAGFPGPAPGVRVLSFRGLDGDVRVYLFGVAERSEVRTVHWNHHTGQEGSYLAELPRGLGYEVDGIVQRVALEDPTRRFGRILGLLDRIILNEGRLETYAIRSGLSLSRHIPGRRQAGRVRVGVWGIRAGRVAADG